jgi:tetratricopeptide (TPR) repeat protein
VRRLAALLSFASACACASVIGFGTTSALAQTSSPTGAEAEGEAKAAMKRGLAAFARRDAETALAEYKKAERLVPDANVPHRYAAEALVELERYEEALQEYETYLRIKPDVSDAGEVQKRMENVRTRLDGTVDVHSSPSGASVFVDGSSSKAGVTPISGLKLRRGSHTILLQLSGKKDVVLSPVVRGGESLSLSASFGGASSEPSHDEGTTSTDGSKTLRTVGWVGLGAGAVVLAGAFVIDAFLLSSAFDTFEQKRSVDDPGAGDQLSRARTLQTMAIVGYAVGGALAVTGATLVLWPRKSNAPVKASASLGGVTLSGSF